MTASRLATGGLVDRTRPLAFRFDGTGLRGFAGDTLASALLANDIAITGRSFKLHRPRGIVGAGFEDGGAIVTRDGPRPATNQLATVLPLEAGGSYRAVNAWPNAAFDIGSVARYFAGLLPAGFYYKTFMLPSWHLFEPLVRRAAGLGRVVATGGWEPVSESRYADCEVLVVGAGPAGLAAALTAGRAGARTMLVDDGPEPGGRLLADGVRLDGAPATAWVARATAELALLPNVRVLRRATVWGYHEHQLLTILERDPRDVTGLDFRSWKLRARQVVIATGAIERPIVLADNDRPGVMLASAVRAYLHRFGVLAGRHAVVFTNNDSAYATATDLLAAGATVTIVDSRATTDEAVVATAQSAGALVIQGAVVERALGNRRVVAAQVRRIRGSTMAIDCDLLAVSGGWNPSFHLASQSRLARPVWDQTLATFVAEHGSTPFALAGAARAIFDTSGCLLDGAAAAQAVLRALGREAPEFVPPTVEEGPEARSVEPLWLVPPTRRGAKSFVDLAGDVTTDDLGLALREGYDSIELVKRYTTAGMGVDQGKTGNVNVIGIVAALTGAAPEAVGTTTFRPPFVPIEFGAIAGARQGPRLYPWRHTPLTDWHIANGAVMYEAGLRWQRPGYYRRGEESWDEAAAREARAVRESVGVYDATPLGKLELVGPDVPALLDLLYVGDFASLAPGRGKYSLMLTDDGLILDDGVSFRLDERRWLLHSSTGNADRVHAHLEQLLQVHRPDLRVVVTPVTSQWVNVTVCGPRAREVVRALGPDFDVSAEALPFMGMVTGSLGGLLVRVCRVSWTGEQSFELNTPARNGSALWEKVLAAGRPLGICPVGSEANHILRVEAGYLSTGHEVDGVTDVYDLGLGALVSKTKADFIGKRSMELRRRAEPVRQELVGLLPEEPRKLVPEGAPITPGGERTDQEGFVSSCVTSVIHGRTIALGLLRDGRARHGRTVHARVRDEVIPLQVVPPLFHQSARRQVRS